MILCTVCGQPTGGLGCGNHTRVHGETVGRLANILMDIQTANGRGATMDDLDAILLPVARLLVGMPGPARERLWSILRETDLCTGCGELKGGSSVCYGECFHTGPDSD